MGLKGNQFVTYIFLGIRSRSPFHIGNGGDEILLDTFSNKPYMPATGIAGALKSYLINTIGEIKANNIFGYSNQMSKVYVYDSFSEETLIEKREGVRININTGASEEKVLFTRKYASKGHRFVLRFEIFSANSDENKIIINELYKCFKAIQEGFIRFGGYKTSGAGKFEIFSAVQKDYNLINTEELLEYLKITEFTLNEVRENILYKNQLKNYLNILPLIQKINLNDNYAKFEFKGEILEPLLIKAPSINDSEKPDDESIKEISGKYIIPASTLKGIVRSQCRKILDYYGYNNLLEEIFGNEAFKEDVKISGRVYFNDITIEKSNDESIYHRIKIDKFTGGVMTGALVKQRPVIGSIESEIRLKCFDEINENSIQKNKVSIGILSLALRDLGLGEITVGSGNSIGHGRIKFSSMKIIYKNQQTNIDFENKELSNKVFIDDCIKALKNNI